MPRPPHRVASLATISVNVDSLERLHDELGISSRPDPVAIYAVAIPRVLALLDEVHARATFFVSGKDLAHPKAAEMLQEIVARGHEVATKGYQHAVNMRTWSKLSVAEEIERGSAAIVKVIGKRPQGFRAPGYNVDTRVIQLLAERGFKYDSSVLSSLPFFLVKRASNLFGRAIGRGSDATSLAVHNLRAPTQPYRPSRWAFWEAGSRKHSLPIWEIPVGLMRGTGVPMTSRLIATTPETLLAGLFSTFKLGQPTVHVELHAVDLMDRNDHAIHTELVSKRVNLRGEHQATARKVTEFLRLVQNDYRIVTMDELADELELKAGPTVVA